jgi:hypothetical protein
MIMSEQDARGPDEHAATNLGGHPAFPENY